jgi:hypothetical protein
LKLHLEVAHKDGILNNVSIKPLTLGDVCSQGYYISRWNGDGNFAGNAEGKRV